MGNRRHPHPMKEIALQAGLGLATVDRVLHRRPGVHPQTTRRVAQAIEELDRQREQVGLVGRKFLIDVVLDSPARFTTLVRQALEAECPLLHPAIFRARYACFESATPQQMITTLDGIAAKGSHGVLLTAQEKPELVEAVARLHARGIPVVTLASDLASAHRLAYVGMDNRAAGETAAYLLGQCLGGAAGAVLVSLGSMRFRGHEAREIGFRQYLRQHHPGLRVVEVSEGVGLHDSTASLVRQALAQDADIVAVYSIGGANQAILDAFAECGRRCRAFVGHDLDDDNLELLRRHRLTALLHHDLRHDVRMACLHLMRAQGVGPARVTSSGSSVQVITPCNLPGAADGPAASTPRARNP